MQEEYDFSNAVKGKFYVPKEEIQLPIYLNTENQDFYAKLAQEKRINISKLVNLFLEKERQVISLLNKDG
ncbi:MAG: hypothetical protein AAF518_27600 [Spirochaetota bacterium]